MGRERSVPPVRSASFSRLLRSAALRMQCQAITPSVFREGAKKSAMSGGTGALCALHAPRRPIKQMLIYIKQTGQTCVQFNFA